MLSKGWRLSTPSLFLEVNTNHHLGRGVRTPRFQRTSHLLESSNWPSSLPFSRPAHRPQFFDSHSCPLTGETGACGPGHQLGPLQVGNPEVFGRKSLNGQSWLVFPKPCLINHWVPPWPWKERSVVKEAAIPFSLFFPSQSHKAQRGTVVKNWLHNVQIGFSQFLYLKRTFFHRTPHRTSVFRHVSEVLFSYVVMGVVV